jgi:hypothetical protein
MYSFILAQQNPFRRKETTILPDEFASSVNGSRGNVLEAFHKVASNFLFYVLSGGFGFAERLENFSGVMGRLFIRTPRALATAFADGCGVGL